MTTLDSTPLEGALLHISDLTVVMGQYPDSVTVVDGVSFQIYPGETLAIVGESGAGKSVTLMAILRLLQPTLKVSVRGRALFNGEDLLSASRHDLQRIRGGGVGFVFQDPMTTLNPVVKVGRQIGEALRLHDPSLGRRSAMERATTLLADLGLADAVGVATRYPHQLSGGMRQRVVIAMALANSPPLLFADEPTTALDTTMQANVLRIFKEATRDGTGVVLVTHDFGVVAEVADRVAVMYAGQFVETGSVEAVFSNPRHPYTRGLLASRPRLDSAVATYAIPGNPPNPSDRPEGCAFEPRCALGHGMELCKTYAPPLSGVADEPGIQVACHLAEHLLVPVEVRRD